MGAQQPQRPFSWRTRNKGLPSWLMVIIVIAWISTLCAGQVPGETFPPPNWTLTTGFQRLPDPTSSREQAQSPPNNLDRRQGILPTPQPQQSGSRPQQFPNFITPGDNSLPPSDRQNNNNNFDFNGRDRDREINLARERDRQRERERDRDRNRDQSFNNFGRQDPNSLNNGNPNFNNNFNNNNNRFDFGPPQQRPPPPQEPPPGFGPPPRQTQPPFDFDRGRPGAPGINFNQNQPQFPDFNNRSIRPGGPNDFDRNPNRPLTGQVEFERARPPPTPSTTPRQPIGTFDFDRDRGRPGGQPEFNNRTIGSRPGGGPQQQQPGIQPDIFLPPPGQPGPGGRQPGDPPGIGVLLPSPPTTTRVPFVFNPDNFTPRFPVGNFPPPSRNQPGINFNIFGASGINTNRNQLLREPRYFIVASNMVRPGQVYRVIVTIYKTQLQPNDLEVRASLLSDGVDIGSDTKLCVANIPETLMIRVPKTSVEGDYKLRVEGNDNGLVGGTAFVNETQLRFSRRSMTIFIQTDKPVYMQGQTVRFRAIPINTALRAFDDAVDVYMLDPKANIVRRWLSRQSNFGAVSLNYTLSDQPVYGNWTIRIQALQQIEEKIFWVEEYYEPRFEVNVTMPAFFFDTEEFLSGIVVANFTSGGPVRGNLTLKATVRPIDIRYGYGYTNTNPNIPIQIQQQQQLHQQQQGISTLSVYEHTVIQQFIPNFNGYYEFRFPMFEVERAASQLHNMEVTITASVGEAYWNDIIDGYSKARIYNSTLRLQFLGGSPQVFKPSMVFNCYLTISYQDGSPLNLYRLWKSDMEIQPEVVMNSGVRRRLDTRYVRMLADNPGIWKVSINLKQELYQEGAGFERVRQTAQIINEIQQLQLRAIFTNQYRETTSTELLVVAHYSPKNRNIRVSSSTTAPNVGEYIVFHVRSNFYMDRFTYVVMSKGVILLSGNENMESNIRTFAIPVSPEMAPAATIMVYHVSKYMEVAADSLTYPVNGLSRNNFTVAINNKKEKTNNVVEVIIRGQPGAYVGLSGVDAAFYTMQAGNEISYGEVLNKMITYDEDSNGTLIHNWISREGYPDEVVYFPSHSFGIDANRTFEYAGLVVFSDFELPRRVEFCNETAGQFACYTGNFCYLREQKCDGIRHCFDGTDESNCPWYNQTDLIHFKLYRFNRMQRLYENVWLWKDINIGPFGHFIFTLPVPQRPALWMVSALGVGSTSGLGLLRSPLVYSGVRPLFINVEMPDKCRHGEQVGIRVTVFNYMMRDVEVMVVLANSNEYKFIHVEPQGYVQHYAPRTSYGEHQHLIWIRSQDTVQVHFPIVATKLGKVKVVIKAISQIARDEVTRQLRVEPDGVPQFRHTSILLDLSNRAYVLQFMHINVTESPIIPYDPDRYYVFSSNLAKISVVGDVVGPAYPTMPVNASSLLNKPFDSAEQNMFSFAANLYTLMYLRLTNQRNKTTYREAFHYLNIGYQRQLSFQKEDGSFSMFRSDWNHTSSSVWVTAYCAKVFAEATFNEWENFLFIDPMVISKAVDWVIKFQTLEGSFYEVTPYANRKLNDSVVDGRGGGWIYSPNVTLTAHVLIALHAVRDLPGAVGPRLAHARQKAITYLEGKVDDMKYVKPKPYETALVTYALMISKSPKADSAFIALSEQAKFEGGYAYWGREPVPLPDYKLENNKPFLLPRLPFNYDSENIETTAYALMVYVARQEIRVEAIVRWLNVQRLYDGGWASTQDSAAAMRALIDYTVRQKIREVTDLTVRVEAAALPGVVHTFHVNGANLAIPQSIEIENAFGTVNIEAKGAGYAIIQMQVQFGIDRDRFITQPPVYAFTLTTQAYSRGRNSSIIEYIACSSWTLQDESERSGMAVMEINIPTGYYVYQPVLDRYVLSALVPTLKRARYLTDKVVMYFDYLEINPTCINFTVERWFPVANLTRYLPMRVYDYYAPERYNETIYDSLDLYVLDICQVCGSYQCPYCAIFAGGPKVTFSVSVISAALVSLVLIFYTNELLNT